LLCAIDRNLIDRAGLPMLNRVLPDDMAFGVAPESELAIFSALT